MKADTGFIGTGNMGGILASAAALKNAPGVLVSNRTPEKAKAIAEKTGCAYGSITDAANCRFVVLGVKPQQLEELCETIRPVLAARKDRYIIVSMAAAVTTGRIKELICPDAPVIRIMPNTPCAVGKGMILYCTTPDVTEKEAEEFKSIMELAGAFDETDEANMDAASAIAGCGPAFAFMFMDALADGGVAAGLKKDKALKYAAQTLFGSAALVLESGKKPSELKDAVCSPGGTTIEGVKALEDASFRSACMDAVIKAWEKANKLAEK